MSVEDDRTDVQTIVLWDRGVRLFHWGLALCVTTSWLFGEYGPAIMTWHFWSGYAVIGLLGFRLVWGVAGPRPARFASFLAGPAAVVAYARTLPERRPSHWTGHSPVGGWAVALLLGLLAAQAATGLLSDPEDYINIGPLADTVGPELRRAATAWHDRIARLLLLAVVLHVAVIVFYRVWKRENLVAPMITGRKQVRRR